MKSADVEVYFQALKEKEQNETKQAITIAYITAMLQRVEKVPTLEKLFEDCGVTEKKVQAPEDMLSIVKMLHAQISAKGDT